MIISQDFQQYCIPHASEEQKQRTYKNGFLMLKTQLLVHEPVEIRVCVIPGVLIKRHEISIMIPLKISLVMVI
jgi:hypothetical protein